MYLTVGTSSTVGTFWAVLQRRCMYTTMYSSRILDLVGSYRSLMSRWHQAWMAARDGRHIHAKQDTRGEASFVCVERTLRQASFGALLKVFYDDGL